MKFSRVCFVAFVLLIATSAENVDELEEEDKEPLLVQQSLLQRHLEIAPAALRPARNVSVFCWMVEAAFDLTAELARKQLAQCDDYLVFSNYSNSSRKTINIYPGDDMKSGNKWGWVDVAQRFFTAYKAIMASDLPEKHQWFVKIDPDSFFRARFLRPILSQYDADKPCAIGRPPIGPDELAKTVDAGVHSATRISGSMEIVSYKALRDTKTELAFSQQNQPGGEDTLLRDGFQLAGFDIHVHQTWDQCYKMALDYPNIPKNHSIPHEEWNVSVITDLMREFLSNPSLDCKFVGMVDGENITISRDVVVAHPVKDPADYAELQQLDMQPIG